MDDTLLSGLVEWLIEVTDDRYGRRAAWIMAFALVVLPAAVVICLVVWLTR